MTPYPPAEAETAPAIDVLIESPLWDALPDAEGIVRRAIAFAADEDVMMQHRGGELSVLLCDDAAIADLNARWRGQSRPTNVLSFPVPPPVPVPRGASDGAPLMTPLMPPIGDIAIAYETVAREAVEQGKAVADHLAHLAVHGFLHLLGYDHNVEAEAERMERLERDILGRIGVADPYASRDAEI
jgi:probable rRNA maturation factor